MGGAWATCCGVLGTTAGTAGFLTTGAACGTTAGLEAAALVSVGFLSACAGTTCSTVGSTACFSTVTAVVGARFSSGFFSFFSGTMCGCTTGFSTTLGGAADFGVVF